MEQNVLKCTGGRLVSPLLLYLSQFDSFYYASFTILLCHEHLPLTAGDYDY